MIELFDRTTKQEDQIFVNPEAIKTLFQKVEPYLPPEFRTPVRMSIFFQELGETFHHFQYALKNAGQTRKATPLIELHTGSGATIYLGYLIELILLRAETSPLDTTRIRELEQSIAPKIFRDYFSQKYLLTENELNVERLKTIMKFAAGKDMLRTSEELKRQMGETSAATTFKDYLTIIDIIRRDGGSNIMTLLGTAITTMKKDPIIVDDNCSERPSKLRQQSTIGDLKPRPT